MSRSTAGILLVAALALAALLGAKGCSREDSGPLAPERVLLARAEAALWGVETPVPGAVFHGVSEVFETVDDAEPAYRLELWAAPDGAYREERIHGRFGIREVFGVPGRGGRPWASIDRTPVPLAADEVDLKRLQPLLFEISTLRTLDDATRFRLSHAGKRVLEDGSEVETLEVKSLEFAGVIVRIDFDCATTLARQVRLERKGAELPESLSLADYREAAGAKLAFRLEGRIGEVAHSIELRREAEFLPRVEEGLFAAPAVAEDAPPLAKPSIGGHWAFVEHHGGADRLDASIRRLKTWVADRDLRVDGPLAVHWHRRGTDQPPVADEAVATVLIAVHPPSEPLAEEDVEGFGLCSMSPRDARCLTFVGDETTDELRARIDREIAGSGREPAEDAYEIFFSPDRRTRQLQVPLKVE